MRAPHGNWQITGIF